MTGAIPVAQSPEGQISSMLVRNNQVYAAMQSGRLFRFGAELVRVHFESPVRDAKLTDSWGRVGGVAPATSTCRHELATENDLMQTGANGVAPTRIRKVHK